MTFLQARNYRKGGNADPTRIVVHDMEYPERLDTAEAVAQWFAGPSAPVASAHYLVDSDSIVQAVWDYDTAYHAPPNARSIGIEHAGYARQSRDEWLDAYGQAMLLRSAALTRELCDKYGIPKVKISSADLLAGRRGICGHVDVSLAWHQTTHTDPGPAFPWDWYMAQVVGAAPAPATGQDPLTPAQQAPPFPLPAASYFGPEGGSASSVSGYHSHADDLRAWQTQMQRRGWAIAADGLYGSKGATTPQGQTADVARRFQAEKGLTADALIGPATWAAAWTASIT